MSSIRAIYRGGTLQPLDPVDLEDGQEVQIQILDERTLILDALSDLIVVSDDEAGAEDVDFDEVGLQREIDKATHGVTLSDLIIEERRTGR